MKHFLVNLWAGVLGVSRTVLTFLLPILAGSLATALEQLLPVALSIVSDLSTRGDLSGLEKQELAVARLRDAAVQTGISVGASALNLAVEMAVTKLKASEP